MFKLPHNCTHLTHQQSSAQNSPSRLQQYCELADVQDGFRKGRGTRDQIANICWITGKAREFQKNIYFCFIDYTKAWLCGSQQTVKILKEIGIPDHLNCLLRICMQVNKQQLEPDMEQQTGSKSGKEYVKLYIGTLLI